MRYEFACDECSIIDEQYLPMAEGPGSMTCPKCKETMRHVLGCNFILKGDGWPGKEIKEMNSGGAAEAKAKEETDAMLDRDKRNQRIVDEVTAERRRGTKASEQFQKDNPQKTIEYKQAINAGYRAKKKSYRATGDSIKRANE